MAASSFDSRLMTLFYVMPFITGESLRQRLDRDRWLPVDEVTRLLTGIAAGLGHAHAHGIVHRDIKPENILLQDGLPLLADFGIARASAETGGEQLTEIGLALGTPIYMSPEQASAGYEAVDGRSDIYSLGCVVYEMLAGGPPFAGATAAAILARHCVDAVPPIRTVRPDLPERVVLAVNRALAKRAVDRWQTVAEFVDALRIDTPVLMESAASPAPRLSLAILPFENLSSEPDSDYFGDGLAEELTTVFARIRGLNLASRGAAFALKGQKLDPRVAAQRLGVRTVLEGSVRKAGNRLRITAALTDAATGFELWSDRFDRQLDDIFALQDELASTIARALADRFAEPVTAAPLQRGTRSPQAYDANLRGEYLWLRAIQQGEGLMQARAAFEEALRHDPDYPLAIERYAVTFSVAAIRGLEPWDPAWARYWELNERSLRLDPDLASALVSRGVAILWIKDQVVKAGQDLQRAVMLSPASAECQRHYGAWLKMMGRSEEAESHMREAVRLEPEIAFVRSGMADILIARGKLAEALPHLRLALALDPKYDAALERLWRVCRGLERYEDAIDARRRQLEARKATERADQLVADFRASGYQVAWERDRRRELADWTDRRAALEPVKELQTANPVSDRLVILNADLGDWSRAMDWILTGHAQRPGRLRRVLTDLPFDRRNLIGDPRYRPLLEQAGLLELLAE